MTFAEVIDTNAVDEETKVNRELKTGLMLKKAMYDLTSIHYHVTLLICILS